MLDLSLGKIDTTASSLNLPPFNYFSAVNQGYMIRAGAEDVIMGNNALLKCSIPSFVADLISVVSWHDTDGSVYIPNPLNYGNLGFWLRIPLVAITPWLQNLSK